MGIHVRWRSVRRVMPRGHPPEGDARSVGEFRSENATERRQTARIRSSAPTTRDRRRLARRQAVKIALRLMAILSTVLFLAGCRVADQQQTGLSASTELVCSIRQLEEQRGNNTFEVLRANVALKARSVITARGLASLRNEQYRYGNDAYPTRVEVVQDRIEVTEPFICIWKLLPVVVDGKVQRINVAYVPICLE